MRTVALLTVLAAVAGPALAMDTTAHPTGGTVNEITSASGKIDCFPKGCTER